MEKENEIWNLNMRQSGGFKIFHASVETGGQVWVVITVAKSIVMLISNVHHEVY